MLNQEEADRRIMDIIIRSLNCELDEIASAVKE
jgi:hypothetical protein